MPDYIYLLENRLSADQQNALRQLREAAREAGMILFLSGDAVRELTSGHAVRALEVSVHGNALKLKKTIEGLGGAIWGESTTTNTLYVCFPGTVRVDVVSTHRLDYTNIASPVYHPASIQEDLRRRDFTGNAMAISLNEGSFGLLMDPLNGAADIESRTLRLVSNYGFLEEPSLLIRASRYKARLGWEMDPKTSARYENARGEGVIEKLSPEAQSRELEQIGHEDEALKILRTLEEEGWMKYLFPAWTPAKADEEKLKELHALAIELLQQGVHADMSAAQMQLLTAKMNPKDLAALKKMMLRPGFVEEWNSLDALAAKFAKVLLSKEYATASAGYKLLTTYDPEAVLWLAFTSKDKAVQARFNQFLKVWPEARQRIPHALMQEMRITPELATYKEIVQSVFLQLIDGNLATPEEMRAFLEPHSPPAPPPQVTVKRPRAKRGEAKAKERTYDDDDEESDDAIDDEDDLDDLGGDDDDIDLGLPKVDIEPDAESDRADDDKDEEGSGLDTEPSPPPAKRASKSSTPAKVQKEAPRAAVPPKSPAPVVEATAVPAATPAKTAPPAKAAGAEPNSRKGKTMSEKVAEVAASNVKSAPGVKPPQTQALSANIETALRPGAKPPQVGKPTRLSAMTANVLGVKPPQVGKPTPLNANALRMPGVKPPQVGKPVPMTAKPVAAPSVKSPQGKKPISAAKTISAPAKKTSKGKAPVKAAVAKPTPAKVKPKAKPVKKAAPAKAARPAPKAAKKKR